MKNRVRIGIIGDYDAQRPSHRATEEALAHCGAFLNLEMNCDWLPTDSLETRFDPGEFDGIWCAPGIYRSSAGALRAIRAARECGVPFLATCQGCQHAVMEYARNCMGIADAGHAEMTPDAPNPIITALSCSFIGEDRTVYVEHGSRAHRIYKSSQSVERFTCNFGINPLYRAWMHESGFRIAGVDENGEPRLLELSHHPFFVATLFQPQLTSSADQPHPLILALLQSASAGRCA